MVRMRQSNWGRWIPQWKYRAPSKVPTTSNGSPAGGPVAGSQCAQSGFDVVGIGVPAATWPAHLSVARSVTVVTLGSVGSIEGPVSWPWSAAQLTK